MLAMFGLGPMELAIVGGLCCIGPVLSGAVVLVIVLVNRKSNAQGPDPYASLEAESRRLKDQLAQQERDQLAQQEKDRQ